MSAAENDTQLALGLRARVFDVPFDMRATVGGPGGWSFAGRAKFHATLSELLARLQGPVPAGEEWFAESPPVDVDVTSLAVGYRAESGSLSLRSDFDVRVKGGPTFDLAFVFARSGGAPHGEGGILVGLFSCSPIDFAAALGPGAGLVGRFLGGLELDSLGLFYASAAQEIDGALVDAREAGPAGFPAGLSVAARLGSNGNYTDIALPPPPEKEPTAVTGAPEQPKPKPEAEVKLPAPGGAPLRIWKPLDKTIGPLKLRRIGGEWHDGKLGILLDAEVALAGLKVGLAGLAVKAPPSKLSKLSFADLDFALDGLELAFSRGPVSIAGALLRTLDGDRVGYAGMASIRAASFSVAAIGAYSTTREDEPAFFIFGAYSGVIGGPPCFLVTGIAAGFGYNRAITLPEIDEVRDFPLVSLALGSGDGSGRMIEQLGSLNRFPAVTGQYWVAAGIKFTSFNLVEAFALVTAQFGTRFEIALLGVANLRQPPAPAASLVVVEMALKARFAPDDGLLSVMAVLTANSFLFDTRCKLTGGFAFCVWLPPTDPKVVNRAGDFVLTLGGYHPKFQPPAHYPKVPRIGFDWQLPECGVAIRGEAYFALTPSFIMAGARLSAVFRAGDFKAWFDAHADFLIGWAPLHYEADVGVRIGAAFTLRLGSISWTLSFELAANLTIWGPPFAGEVYIDIGIVAFTVPIGDRTASREPPTVYWPEFADAFLPPEPLAIVIAAGLVEERTGAGGYVIVNPSDLCLAVDAFIPISDLDETIALARDVPARTAPAPRIGVRPTGQATLESRLKLTFARETAGNTAPQEENMVRRPVRKSAPEALWSHEPMPDAKKAATLSAKVIEEVLMGAQILPAECRKFRSIEVAVAIESVAAPLPERPQHVWSDARYDEPKDRARLFREGWKAPVAAVATALGAFAFDIPTPTVAAAFPDLWQATPALVPIGDLPSPEHGA